jgi:hypothetical protein
MSEPIYCCGKAAKKRQVRDTGMFEIDCEVCDNHVSESTAEKALAEFKKIAKGTPDKPAKSDAKPDTNRTPGPQKASSVPATAEQLAVYAADHIGEFAALTVPFVARDKPALVRLLKNNIRHVMQRSKDKSFSAVWQTKEGQESIVFALEEAMSLGAELGKMGSLVPYGSIVEFIPAVEAYEFALTNGGNPPFSWIQIDMIHENDIKEIARINGEFSCKIQPGVPRGALMAIAVYGKNNRLGHVVGEVYDVDRLLGKARQHSSSYKYYLLDLQAFKIAQTEQKTKTEGGREYFMKEVPKRDGGTWNKKVFYDEITNPYEGPDQPEMLRKAAGKSFLGKYARIRNSEAAVEEMKGDSPDEVEATIDRTIDAAFEAAAQDGEVDENGNLVF